MCLCDICKVEESIRKSNEPSCCAWHMDNVVIAGKSEIDCTVFKPTDSTQKVCNNKCPGLYGYIVKWINDELFIAYVTSKYGRGEMLCHKDNWTIF